MKSRSVAKLFSSHLKSFRSKLESSRRRTLDRIPLFEFSALESRILFGGGGNVGSDGFGLVQAPYTEDVSDQSSANNGTNGNSNDSNNSCCNGNTIVDPAGVGMGSAAASTNPVRLYDGMPIISSNDLSANVLGINWGVTREWTGLNNAGPAGNGWSIAELPYLIVSGDTQFTGNWGDPGATQPASQTYVNTLYLNSRITVVEGKSSFNFQIPSDQTFASGDPNAFTFFPAMGATNATLKEVGGEMQLTDAEGDVTEFYDVARRTGTFPIPIYFP